MMVCLSKSYDILQTLRAPGLEADLATLCRTLIRQCYFIIIPRPFECPHFEIVKIFICLGGYRSIMCTLRFPILLAAWLLWVMPRSKSPCFSIWGGVALYPILCFWIPGFIKSRLSLLSFTSFSLFHQLTILQLTLQSSEKNHSNYLIKQFSTAFPTSSINFHQSLQK